jgi:hypothetical protein
MDAFGIQNKWLATVSFDGANFVQLAVTIDQPLLTFLGRECPGFVVVRRRLTLSGDCELQMASIEAAPMGLLVHHK